MGITGISEGEVSMFEIAMIACLASNGSICRDVSLTFADDYVTAVQCSMGMAGQQEIAKWVEAHPQWKPARWTCRTAGQYAKI